MGIEEQINVVEVNGQGRWGIKGRITKTKDIWKGGLEMQYGTGFLKFIHTHVNNLNGITL